MQRNELLEHLIKTATSQYALFVSAKFKELNIEEPKTIDGIFADDPDVKLALISPDAISSMSREELSLFFTVSVYMINTLSEVEEYMFEHVPGAFEAYKSVEILVAAIYEENKDNKQEN